MSSWSWTAELLGKKQNQSANVYPLLHCISYFHIFIQPQKVPWVLIRLNTVWGLKGPKPKIVTS